MVADGIEIDLFSLLRLKDQLLRVLGFEEVSLVPSPTGHTFHVRSGEIDLHSDVTGGLYAHPLLWKVANLAKGFCATGEGSRAGTMAMGRAAVSLSS